MKLGRTFWEFNLQFPWLANGLRLNYGGQKVFLYVEKNKTPSRHSCETKRLFITKYC